MFKGELTQDIHRVLILAFVNDRSGVTGVGNEEAIADENRYKGGAAAGHLG